MDLAKPIVIIDDPLICTQPDTHVSNFDVDECGNTVLLDFAEIGRLQLAKYTMRSDEDDIFIPHLSNLLRWLDNFNMNSMARVSSCLWMMADPTLGTTTCA